MTKSKLFYKHIILPYKIETFISVNQTDAEFISSLEKEFPKTYAKYGKVWSESVAQPFAKDIETTSARTVQYASGLVGLRFFDLDFFSLVSANIVVHEFAHVTSYVFSHINMPHTDDTDEAYAYLIAYLVENFYTNVTKYGKVQYGKNTSKE